MPALVRVRLLLDKAVLGTPTRVFPDDTTVEDVQATHKAGLGIGVWNKKGSF